LGNGEDFTGKRRRARNHGDTSRHGPIGIEPLSGDVVGFAVSFDTHAFEPLYVTARLQPGVPAVFEV
jgi:hypothetical protein